LDRKVDGYRKMARELGYRSRAAFKLLQLNKRYGLLKRGDVVVDLGAAPGGWLQVARRKVGEEGFVLGVDILPIRPLPYENVLTLVADIREEQTVSLILQSLPRKADVVLSDASPQISGVWEVDHSRSVELCRCVLRICERVLRAGGNALIKIFQGEEFDSFFSDFSKKFDFVKVSKPEASRRRSAEIYLVGKGYNPWQT
jgi:23S rRNA (uridine2552-2'-O)-methyltransferase